ncbi:MAG TPA: hypothetical protein VII73_12740 [Caulobacteraceae bacterium]
MTSLELDTLIFNNWVDLEAAATRVQEMEDETFAAVNETAEAWSKARGWSGVFEGPDGGCWFSPPAWTTTPGKRPNADAWFGLDFQESDGDQWYLTSLMGEGVGRAVIQFQQTRVGARKWREIARDPKNIAKLPAFTLDDTATYFIPLRIDRSLIAEAIEAENFRDSLAPLIAVLDRLEEAVPILGALLGDRAGTA